ncbi:type II toxin-antitoxin system RelE/ParE family toxin [Flavobacterium zepuense]|uniref:Type II toxin-antitoxin system RelE/ParE family toxin n=1 Tax=Flavobacterium zepuense TaxID=2593302 RepID=A0A552V2Y9_9FLAO|nr:type II toxin-antitoxin system RelE/ParE family toxin [Flavobacterium zepuense]TRW24829.1 type II toxin-antitoxin system RelE/ParE family toxin [Flavobacterium zepuense]
MGFKLDILLSAKIDIWESMDWYNEKQPGLGNRFYEDFAATVKYIITNPYLFPVKRRPLRECVLKKFPFIIIYDIHEENVIIHAVFNTSKNPGQKPKKY